MAEVWVATERKSECFRLCIVLTTVRIVRGCATIDVCSDQKRF